MSDSYAPLSTNSLCPYLCHGLSRQLSYRLSTSQEWVKQSVDEENTTLLHLAANSSSPRALQFLLQQGALVNSQNGDGLTALHVAAMWGKEEAVGMLLEYGADPGIPDEEDLLPLDHAREQGV